MKRTISGILVMLLLTGVFKLAFNVQTAKTEPIAIVVPDDYPTIQEAVNAADDGDIVYVNAGTYYENVVAGKSISIIGESPSSTIIDGDGLENVVTVIADDVMIANFTIRNSIWYGSGIILNPAANCLIKSNNIINNGGGIDLNYLSNNNTICGNNITANSGFGIYLDYSSNNALYRNKIADNWHGIHLLSSSNNKFRDNTIARNRPNFGIFGDCINDIDTSNTVDGKPIYYLINQADEMISPHTYPDIGYLALVNSKNITVEGLEIKNNGNGILLSHTEDTIIRDNIFINNSHGIHLISSLNNVIQGNDVSGGSYMGIFVQESRDNTFSQNRITRNGAGFYLQDSVYNGIYRNNIIGNGAGLKLHKSSHNQISGNNITANSLRQASATRGYSNIWNDGYPSGGNYWSDHTGGDFFSGTNQNEAGSDGISDTPYVINTDNTDNFPLMRPYHGSVRNLDSGQSYPTIQKGINNASENDRILTLSGIYYENVVVNKTVLLLGEDRQNTIVRGIFSSQSSVINLTANDAVITGFTLENGYYGIYLSANNCTVHSNEIIQYSSDSNLQIYYGMWLHNSNNNTIYENVVHGMDYDGIRLHNSLDNLLEKNEVKNVGAHGIFLYNSSSNISVHNMLNSNWIGLHLDALNEGNKILENSLLENELGLSIVSSSVINNTFHHNNFVNNTEQVQLYGHDNTWDDGAEGNYWSDYNGIDSGDDGIGDTPYIIDEHNIDRYPLMYIYWNPCDIHHDLKVDMRDVGIAARAIFTQPGDSDWNPHADITGPEYLVPDGKVDMRDLGSIAKNFGETWLF